MRDVLPIAERVLAVLEIAGAAAMVCYAVVMLRDGMRIGDVAGPIALFFSGLIALLALTLAIAGVAMFRRARRRWWYQGLPVVALCIAAVLVIG
jgi:hypothetical protein